MARFCGHLRNAAAFGVLLTLLATEARAGSIEIILTVAGAAAQPIIITKGGPFDTSAPGNPDIITVNTAALNSTLIADGSSLQFSSLGASSNNPGGLNAVLTQTGQATTLGGAVSFTTLAEQTSYTSPAAASGLMQSSASNTYTNTTAGDSQAFQSWYDGTNTPAKTTPSPILTFTSTGLLAQSNSATAPLTSLTPFVTPFALLNQMTISLAASAMGPTDQFTGSTVVTSAIPEPTSVALLGIGMTGFLALRRLLRRTSAA
jgi:hypothetical protein